MNLARSLKIQQEKKPSRMVKQAISPYVAWLEFKEVLFDKSGKPRFENLSDYKNITKGRKCWVFEK